MTIFLKKIIYALLFLPAGLVTSLQKDITSKDHNIQQLKTEVEKFRRESREKDNQLAQVSAQVNNHVF